MAVTWNPALIDGPITIVLHGEFDPETGRADALGVRPGYRLNMLRPDYEARPDLAPWRVEPERLARVFAGDDPENPTLTIALEFPGEAEAVEVLGAAFLAAPDA